MCDLMLKLLLVGSKELYMYVITNELGSEESMGLYSIVS